MLDKSFEFATRKHLGQFRKVSGLPYVSHPAEVARLIGEFKQSKKILDLQVAGYLHDTIEDTDTTFIEIATEFSPLAASLVLEVTSDPVLIAKMGKLEYLKKKMLGLSSWGLIVKLCDRLSNIKDNPTPKMKIDTKELLEFLKENRKLSNTHMAIIDNIEVYL